METSKLTLLNFRFVRNAASSTGSVLMNCRSQFIVYRSSQLTEQKPFFPAKWPAFYPTRVI